ncbi:imm11 family protein [Terricaulis silvestris]|uniref:Immunity MXAN-0049 protein domain-containing protein n=1 Tax=Terricaulis silvestris TaxID=2686094 RepID=A0A6I6MNF0_9CAUL|nr:DUF1629 domain-containing protein [Terricaulis silvestris]QGZ94287.1 hypothetical protein DSM104635_01103 [Terricaulis silvestris]
MGKKIYSFVSDDCTFADWINQPPPFDAHWSLDIAPGPLADPGDCSGGVGSGFAPDMPKPELRFERPRVGLHLCDIQTHNTRGIVVMSDRAKGILEAIDASSAFEFREAIATLHDGSPAPKYWLADLTRRIAALDETHPAIKIEEKWVPRFEQTQRRLLFGIDTDLLFKSDLVGDHHIFGLLYSPSTICCDDIVVNAIYRHRLVGQKFWPMGETV